MRATLARVLASCAAACAISCAAHPDAVPVVGGAAVSFDPGPGAGFNSNLYPEIVEGGPEGGGASAGSLDVLSLGQGGTLVFEFPGYVLCDGPGPDLLVFENAFYLGGDPSMTFAEPAFVGVADEAAGPFSEWPCDPSGPPWDGCAGAHPVYASSDAPEIDPTDPDAAGGDAFDLSDLGLDELRFVRVRDASETPPAAGVTNAGADIDAIVAIHACPR